MEASVLKGQLTYINTDKNYINITDDGESIRVEIIPETRIPTNEWQEIIGHEVEAIIIDSKVKTIEFAGEE